MKIGNESVGAVYGGIEGEIRLEVEAEIREKYSKSQNPVVKFLLEAGVLADMEVMRRCAMQSKSNKEIYLYNNKLSTLKTYISVVKDTYSVQEKQTKISAAERDAQNDNDEIEIVMKR